MSIYLTYSMYLSKPKNELIVLQEQALHRGTTKRNILSLL